MTARTKELATSNEQVIISNEELSKTNHDIKLLNDSLDERVQERTDKVQSQLAQLLKYAHINSHEVRAPLSRIQGLIPIILAEKDEVTKREFLQALKDSSDELDQIIREMNDILTSQNKS